MDTLQAMKVFARVAQRSGFAAAGRDLSLSPAAITKHIAALEERVGARLLDRTTRRVGLTEAGRIYLDHCLECLQAFEDADASIGELSKDPKGLLRVAAPVDLGTELAPIVARLMSEHTRLRIELQLSNRPVDLVEEGIDVAMRVAPSLDGRYVARQVAVTRVGVFAAPSYLRRAELPREPQDLARHRALVFLEPRPRDEWTFERQGRSVPVKFDGCMTSNSGAALAATCAAGAGVLVAPSFVTRGELVAGRLEALLAGWTVLPVLKVRHLSAPAVSGAQGESMGGRCAHVLWRRRARPLGTRWCAGQAFETGSGAEGRPLGVGETPTRQTVAGLAVASLAIGVVWHARGACLRAPDIGDGVRVTATL